MSGSRKTPRVTEQPTMWPPRRAKFVSFGSSEGDAKKITTVVATPGQGPEVPQEISYTGAKTIGRGSFGVVYRAHILETGETVAIKKVLQDKRFKNRELQVMRKLDHCNIVKLKYFFFSSVEKREEVYLHLVLEFVPQNLFCAAHQKSRSKVLPTFRTKLYMYQLFRSLAYIHSLGICHRDIKPQNLLLDEEKGVVKLCDFGSAKCLVNGETNVSYICSRYYRAPELIFGATNYTVMVDVWSAGCVFAELLLGRPLFRGDSGVDQLVEIIKVLGTPTKAQLHEMNQNYTDFRFPTLKSLSWENVFEEHGTPPEAIDLVSKIMVYTPSLRYTPLQACAHEFFDELREPGKQLTRSCELPDLFNFTEHELKIQPSLNSILIPPHVRNIQCNRQSTGSNASGMLDTGCGSSGSGGISSLAAEASGLSLIGANTCESATSAHCGAASADA